MKYLANYSDEVVLEKVEAWLEDEELLGSEIVNAIDNKEEIISDDDTDKIIYGRATCAEGLLKQIKKWRSELWNY